MTKFVAFAEKANTWRKTPQAKRDYLLVSAAVGAVVSALKQFGVV